MNLISGKVIVHGEEGDRIYQKKEQDITISEKDEIRSGNQSRAYILLQNKNETIELYSNSYLIIDQISEQGSTLSLPLGKARFIVKPTFQIKNKIRRRFRVRTTNAIIGVKGTNFLVQTLKNITSILTLEGSVSLANLGAFERVVELSRNMTSRIVGSEVPTKPIKVPQKQRQKILQQDNIEGLEGVGFQDRQRDLKPEENIAKDAKNEVSKIRSIVNQSNAIREGVQTSIKFKVTNNQ